MAFSRIKPLGWAWGETLASVDMTALDLDHSRAIDGHAGGAYNPTAAIVINNQFEVDSTGAAGVNVRGIIATGKGAYQGVYSTGGASSGDGVRGIGGAPNGDGVSGIGTGTGDGLKGAGGGTDGPGVRGQGGATNGIGVIGVGSGTGDGVSGTGGATDGIGVNGQGTGSGTGVKGVGGGTSGTGGLFTGGVGNGRGVWGTATGNQNGVEGLGGPTDGTGVYGTGQGSGVGVTGVGGAISGIGVYGVGGAPDGVGVSGKGDGNGAGVYGIGGDSDAAGGHFKGGTTNGIGALIHATGTGEGVWIKRFAGAHLMLDMSSVTATDPVAPVEGQIWAESNDDEIIAYMDSSKHQLLDTWVHGMTNGTANVTIEDDNNVTSVTATATTITVVFSPTRQFANTYYAATVTIHDALKLYAVVVGQGVGSFDFDVYNDAGVRQDPTAAIFAFGAIVKGHLA